MLDGSNCLDQEQLHGQQDAANMSRGLVGSGVLPSDLSLKADPLALKKFVCTMPRSPTVSLEDRKLTFAWLICCWSPVSLNLYVRLPHGNPGWCWGSPELSTSSPVLIHPLLSTCYNLAFRLWKDIFCFKVAERKYRNQDHRTQLQAR